MPYNENTAYAKYLQKKCAEEESEGCSDCNDCKEGCDEKCSCCPAGLVAVYDSNGVHQGCLTPNDAEIFHTNNFTCKDGYVKLYKNSPLNFLGCVSESEFATLYAAINP